MLFLVAGVTDFFDGEIARRYGDRHELREVDGSAGGQNHDGGGVHFVWCR